MKKILSIVLLGLLLQVQVFATTIPSGTLVVIKPVKDINADYVKVGDSVDFVVNRPVTIDNQVVINAGTKVFAKVIKKKNNGLLGIPGEISVGDFQIITDDNKIIMLNGKIEDKGENRYWANAGWLLFFPFLFIKGNDGNVSTTSVHMLYIDTNIDL